MEAAVALLVTEDLSEERDDNGGRGGGGGLRKDEVEVRVPSCCFALGEDGEDIEWDGRGGGDFTDGGRVTGALMIGLCGSSGGFPFACFSHCAANLETAVGLAREVDEMFSNESFSLPLSELCLSMGYVAMKLETDPGVLGASDEREMEWKDEIDEAGT